VPKISRALVAAVLAVLLATMASQPASVALAGSVTQTAVADTSVSAANPATNYGTATPLHVDGSPVVALYVRFSVPNVAASNAVLSLFPTSSQSIGFDVHPLVDTTWTESGLTWNNHPAWDPTVSGSSGPATAGVRLNVNLPPAAVSNRTVVSFVLTTTSATALALASRESVNPPQLTITSSSPSPSPTPTATPTLTPTSTPTLPPTPPPTAPPSPTPSPQDPIVLTAGDIGCGLIAGGGMSPGGACQQAATASLLGAAGVVAVLPLGDNEYECGELSNFQSFYGPSWGQYKGLTYPVVGNHEYLTTGGSTPCLTTETQAGAPGYFTYFGNAASPQETGCSVACKGYYGFDLGAWHLIALNAECGSPGVGGCGPGSPQETWLKADLAAHANRCVLAYWHQPRFTSGQEGDTVAVQTFWSDLYDARADLVLNGHDHDYERFGQLGKISTTDSSGAEQPVVDPRGMREIVVGTGGRNLTRFPGGFKTGSQVHDSSSFGVLKLSLHATSYDWSFLPAGGATFTDSGTTSCRFATAPLDTTAPAAPTGLQVATTSTTASLSWAAATDNVGVAAYRVLRNGALIATIAGAGPAYVDSSVVAGQSYSYAVQAVDAAGNQSASSSQVNVVIPQGSGTLTGIVTNRATGAPIVGATINDAGGSALTDSTGHYQQTVPASTFTVTAAATGFASASATVTVASGATVTQDFALVSGGCITGTITDASGAAPLVGAVVAWSGGNAVTDAAGGYRLTGLADGSYSVTASKAGFGPRTATVTVSGGNCPAASVALSPDIFSDGFDSGTFAAWDAGSAFNTTVESTTVHTGTGAAESNVLNTAYRVTKTLPSTYPEVFVRAYFDLHSKSTNVGIYRIRTAAGIDLLHLYVDSASGQLGIRNDVTGVATLSGHAMTLDSWHAIETRTVVNGTSSTVQVWLDGVDQVALDSTTANLGTTNVGQVLIGDTNARTLDAFWDDVAVADARIGS